MRLDVYLAKHALAKSRSYAGELIKKGLVEVDGKKVTKPSFDVTDGSAPNVVVKKELYSFVGRGGVKLDYALDVFEIDVTGRVCVDVGASTGGFTDCLISRGAKLVFAIDSGHGQLDKKLCENSKVVNIEGFNAKNLTCETLGTTCDVAVCDLSFISQTLVIERISSVLNGGAVFVSLIKPQFECGRAAVGKGGIVKKAEMHEYACKKVIEFASKHGFECRNVILSPIEGGDGNKEYLAYFVKSEKPTVNEKMIREAVYVD